MKDETKTKPCAEARGYGVALENGLIDLLRSPEELRSPEDDIKEDVIDKIQRYARGEIKEGLADRLLGIPDAQKAIIYGWAIEYALRYARDEIKESLVNQLLDIPDAQKAKEETHR